MANIPDLNEPWGGHSGLEVETFIKGRVQALTTALDGKFGYVTYDPNTMGLKFYDHEGGTILGDVTFGGDVYSINLHCNLTQTFYVLANEATKVMTIAPTTTKTPFSGGSSEDVPEAYTYTVAVDNGTGYVNKITDNISVGGSASFDVRNFLLTGNNFIRVSVTGLTSGKTQTTVFTATLTSLYLECSHTWQNVWHEGQGYVLNGIRFAGSLTKVLHVSVKYGATETELDPVEYGPNVSYTTTSTTYAIPMEAFPIVTAMRSLRSAGGQSGNCTINLWMTAQGVSTPVVSFDIMCVKTGDTTPLVAINALVPKAYNFTTGRLFSYAVYNADKAVFTLSATLGNTTYPIVQNTPATGLVAGVQYPFSYDLEVDTGANNNPTGTMAISAKAYMGTDDGPTVAASTLFDNSNSFLATQGYLFYLNAATRSNNSVGRELIVNEAGASQDGHFAADYIGNWTGLSWSDDGWAEDNTPSPPGPVKALVIPAGASLSVPTFAPLGLFSNYASGMTIEMMIKTGMPADYATPVLTLGTTSAGLLVYPTKIVVFSNNEQNETSQSVVFAENTMTHLCVTFTNKYGDKPGRNLCSIYVNGVSNVNFPFSGLSNFGNGGLYIGQQNTDFYLYKMRVYGFPLEAEAVKNNFLNCIVNGVEFTRSVVVEKNDVMDGGVVDYNKCRRAGYNTMVIILPNDTDTLPSYEHQHIDKEGTAIKNARVDFEYADNHSKDASIDKVKLDGQGTTSMKYYRWNQRFKTSDSTTWSYGDGTTGANGKKGKMINDNVHVKVDRITAKKNYASSMQGHKMGLTGLYNDIFHQAPVSLNTHLPDPSYLVAVYQFPFVGFRKYSNGFYEYIGLYTAGPDKSSKVSFGYSTKNEDFPNLMSIEGPNHQPRATRFITPWIDVAYDQNEETLTFGGEEGWDCAIAGPNETSNEGSQADWDAILALFNSEWRPAYDCVYNNSPYIAALSDALSESGFANLAAINASDESVAAFQGMTTGGVSNELLAFYDSNYDFIVYRNKTKRYVKLSDEFSDPLLEYNAVTPLYNAGYLATQSPTTAQIKAARVARFRATAADFWDMDQTLYHYCYCLLLGVTDNFAKNTYPFKFRAFSETLGQDETVYCKRWGWRQDDLDTALATDNNGRSTKSYSVEHGDTNQSGGQIFNGGDSALWVLIRDQYGDEQKDMMGRIVQAMGNIANAKGVVGNFLHETVYNVVSLYCWDKSSKYFSQTLYEQDKDWSYVEPWYINDQTKYNDVYPWEQALGDQLQAEKMWVQRRVAYIFSKYRLGAFTGTDTAYNGLAITLASSYNFRITPAIDLYPVGSTGTTDSQSPRTRVGVTTDLPVAAGSGTTNNYIHGLDWIASLGDLKNMVLTDRGADTNIAFVVKSDRLQVLKVGDSDPTAVLFNATSLQVESPSLTHIDAQNTIKVTNEVRLFNCPRLRTCLFAGSNASGLLLPVGALLTEVSFPSAATTVFMHSLSLLQNSGLTLPTLTNIQNLYINNCSQLEPFTIASAILAATGNRLAYVTILWQGIVHGDVTVLTGLAALSGYVKFENGEPTSVAGTPDVEGMVQIDGMYVDDYEQLDIVSEEPYGQNMVKALSDLFNSALYIIYDPNTVWIRFADSAVEAICVAHWDTNHDQHLSANEAAAVTTLSNYFNGNTEITEFDELERFTGLTSLNDSSQLSNGAFYGCTALTKVTIPENVTSLPAGSFGGCESLSEITIKGGNKALSVSTRAFNAPCPISRVNLDDIIRWCRISWDNTGVFNYGGSAKNIRLYKNGVEITSVDWPTTLNSISQYKFYHCVGLQTINIPNNVTSIGTGAFQACTGLTSLDIPSSVESINVSVINYGTARNGTIRVAGRVTGAGASGQTISCKNIIIGGNFSASGNYAPFDGRYVYSIRIGGNITVPSLFTNLTDATSSGSTITEFVEVMGTISGDALYANNTARYIKSGTILHFGLNGIACTPTIAAASLSRISKIYVGPGESQAGDQAILDQYLADADWANYASKLATWWSYNGPYKETE